MHVHPKVTFYLCHLAPKINKKMLLVCKLNCGWDQNNTAIEQFSVECRKTKTKVITLANNNGHGAIHCSIKTQKQLHEARENLREQVMIGSGFTSDWLRKWREVFKPITGGSNVKPK